MTMTVNDFFSEVDKLSQRHVETRVINTCLCFFPKEKIEGEPIAVATFQFARNLRHQHSGISGGSDGEIRTFIAQHNTLHIEKSNGNSLTQPMLSSSKTSDVCVHYTALFEAYTSVAVEASNKKEEKTSKPQAQSEVSVETTVSLAEQMDDVKRILDRVLETRTVPEGSYEKCGNINAQLRDDSFISQQGDKEDIVQSITALVMSLRNWFKDVLYMVAHVMDNVEQLDLDEDTVPVGDVVHKMMEEAASIRHNQNSQNPSSSVKVETLERIDKKIKATAKGFNKLSNKILAKADELMQACVNSELQDKEHPAFKKLCIYHFLMSSLKSSNPKDNAYKQYKAIVKQKNNSALLKALDGEREVICDMILDQKYTQEDVWRSAVPELQTFATFGIWQKEEDSPFRVARLLQLLSVDSLLQVEKSVQIAEMSTQQHVTMAM